MALAANAILLPPQLAADSPDDDKAMEALVVDPFKRSVALECPGCPSASLSGDALQWTQDTGNTFRIDFQTGPFEDTLEIDGVQLYPPPFGSFFESFHVTQINPDNPEAELIKLRVSGYRLDYSSAQTVTEGGIELLPVTFRIVSIESEPVNPPVLEINLLKDAQGRLMIASVDTAPVQPTKEEECNEWPLLCKWRAAVAEKFSSMKSSMRKGCHSKHKGNHMQEGTEEQMGHHPHHRPEHSEGDDRPHHHHGHHGHHGDHHHRMHMFVRRAFFTILVPILIGVIAGTLTYLIGMALGCVIAIIVAKVRGQDAYQPVSLEDGDGEEHDEPRGEKEVYAELPEYDSPPVYEEAAEKEVVDEAR